MHLPGHLVSELTLSHGAMLERDPQRVDILLNTIMYKADITITGKTKYAQCACVVFAWLLTVLLLGEKHCDLAFEDLFYHFINR